MNRGVLAAIAAVALACPAQAAIVTRSFALDGFKFGPEAPVNPVTGQLTITFDDAVDVAPTTAGLTVSGLNIALDYAVQFSSYRIGPVNTLMFGTELSGDASSFVDRTKRTFSATFAEGFGNIVPSDLRYTTGDGNIYVSLTDFGIPDPKVPEPGTWAMMLAGFGMLGATARRHVRARSRLIQQPL